MIAIVKLLLSFFIKERMDKDKGKFETVLEVDGEIIFKDDRAFYYKVRDKLNQEIDVTIKENKKIIRLRLMK